jgi:hypothetical protein
MFSKNIRFARQENPVKKPGQTVKPNGAHGDRGTGKRPGH